MRMIDLTYTIDELCMTCGTPWHTNVELKSLGRIKEVGRNTHIIKLGSHTGTHIDAPVHFFDGMDGIDKLPLDKVCGECQVVDFTYIKAGEKVELKDVENLKISTRMIFRFDWFKQWQNACFYVDFPFFSMEAAVFLMKNGLQVIALDTPSPDTGKCIGECGDSPVHKLFLQNEITIIEYLNGTDCLDVRKTYKLIALPLKLRDCDGAPARVVVMED